MVLFIPGVLVTRLKNKGVIEQKRKKFFIAARRVAGCFRLKSWSSFRAPVDDILRDEMGDQGRLRADMKGAGVILHRAVGDGDALVLPQMLRPGLDDEV